MIKWPLATHHLLVTCILLMSLLVLTSRAQYKYCFHWVRRISKAIKEWKRTKLWLYLYTKSSFVWDCNVLKNKCDICLVFGSNCYIYIRNNYHLVSFTILYNSLLFAQRISCNQQVHDAYVWSSRACFLFY